MKGARSQKTVEEAANVLRARQTDNPSNICHVCGREDWFGRSQEICGVRKREKKRPKKGICNQPTDLGQLGSTLEFGVSGEPVMKILFFWKPSSCLIYLDFFFGRN